MRCTSLTDSEQKQLLELAVASIRAGQSADARDLCVLEQLPAGLQVERASFVTLKKHSRLRGCIGSLSATRPLALDVVENARAAAYRDPRFPPVAPSEYDDLRISLSLLSRPEPMRFESESDLLRQLQPGEDGLLLQDGTHRATFLPAVWSSLPEKTGFLRELKRKAGLPPGYWSDQLTVSRYHAEQIDLG